MRAVSYTRTTSCYPGDKDIPANVIAIQNEHIRKYAKIHQWKITEKYSDRKKDAKENAAFEKLLQDGIQRKFDVVVVDSIFRAGKDLWNAKEVLLQTFHYAGISFAVAEDDFDSTGKSNAEADAYFAEKYKIYRREHIEYQVRERNRNGFLCWNDLLYGYRMSENHQGIVIDEEAAPVVKRIFAMYGEGISVKAIADTLREEKILTPKAVKGTKAKIQDPFRWSALTIRKILSKTMYVGYWTKTVHGVAHEFTNDPIITEEVFDKVQRRLESSRSSAVPRTISGHNRYAGMVCRSIDGTYLHLKKTKSGLEYFIHGSGQGKRSRDKHVLVTEVDEAVRAELKRQRQIAEHILERIHAEGVSRKAALIGKLREDFQNHAMLIAEQEKERMENYQRKFSETGDGADTGNGSLVKNFEKIFLEYPIKEKHIETLYSEENPWIQLMLSWEESSPLEREVLQKYISRVVLGQPASITIEVKETEWYLELPQEWREPEWQGKAEKIPIY